MRGAASLQPCMTCRYSRLFPRLTFRSHIWSAIRTRRFRRAPPTAVPTLPLGVGVEHDALITNRPVYRRFGRALPFECALLAEWRRLRRISASNLRGLVFPEKDALHLPLGPLPLEHVVDRLVLA